jgi:predicted  nucleic acid-binding Zn-ribbon protein
MSFELGGVVQSDLKRLLVLQDTDRVVMGAEESLRALEPEIAELDSVVEQLEQASEQLQAKLEEAKEKRAELETHIETYRVMQERRRQKLEWVRGAKEASALMAEIDLARSVLAKEESDWIRSADEVQEIETVAAEAAERAEAAKEQQAPRREEIAAIRAECNERLADALTRREEAATEIRKSKRSLLALYDRIRSGRAPFAMYELHADACGHCYTSVPMHLRQQIQRSESFATCEACGVLIYIPE